MGYTPHVLVIGGGVIGTGIARDLAIRGLEVTLVERGTLTAGSTGRTQGVLYSGARFADSEGFARLVSRENRTLRKIASHCIESTGGWLVQQNDDSGDEFERLCEDVEAANLPHDVLDGDTARAVVPGLGESVERALSVPDAVVDPFRLTVANAKGAQEYGATVRTHTEVTDIAVENGTVDTVTVESDPAPASRGTTAASTERPDGGESGGTPTQGPGSGVEQFKQPAKPSTDELDPDYVINAAGPWARAVSGLAGLDIDIVLASETMTVVYENPLDDVVTRVRDDATIVPFGDTAVLGAKRRDVSAPEEASVGPGDVETITETATETVPEVETAPTLRAYCGVRSWHPGSENEHQHTLIDHGNRDGCWGMTTVVGGSLTTHRHVAERVADDVCGKFGITRACQTDEIPVPGSENLYAMETSADEIDDTGTGIERGAKRLGDRATEVLGGDGPNPILCECQAVTRAEVRDALNDESSNELDLDEVRIRTTATMGQCQGGLCAHRLASELYPEYDAATTADALDALLDGRWQGQRPALCSGQLQRAMRTYIQYTETMHQTTDGMELVPSKAEAVKETLDDDERTTSVNTVGLSAFDDGQRLAKRDRPTWGERVR